MARKKTKKYNFSSVTIITLSIFVIFLIFFNFFFAKKGLESNQPKGEIKVDTENDGVYSSNQFRLRFVYPLEVFTQQFNYVDYLNEKFGWAKQEWSNKDNSLYLQLEVWDISSNESFYTQYREASKIQENSFSGMKDVDLVERLLNLNSDFDQKSITYYSETDVSSEGQRVWYSYVYAWEQDNQIILLSLGSDNKSVTNTNYKIFENIIKSLRKTDTSN